MRSRLANHVPLLGRRLLLLVGVVAGGRCAHGGPPGGVVLRCARHGGGAAQVLQAEENAFSCPYMRGSLVFRAARKIKDAGWRDLWNRDSEKKRKEKRTPGGVNQQRWLNQVRPFNQPVDNR